MPPRIVHLVRHAQGHHNINWQHYIRDPTLTETGHSQCRLLASTFPHHDTITHVICSPLKRTIQTTLESFHPTIARLSKSNPEFKIPTDPYFQETGEWECDIGSSVPELQKFVENFEESEDSKSSTAKIQGYEYHTHLDFSPVSKSAPDWPQKNGIFAAKNVETRGSYAREYLYNNFGNEDEVLIVSHGGYLHVLTEDWDSYDEMKGTAWENTERRSFVVKKNGEGKVVLEETEESVRSRGGHGVRETDGGAERMEVEAGGHHHSEVLKN
ncbi:hypothetical protein TWF281_011186 [Arthrobotrys megalospora]